MNIWVWRYRKDTSWTAAFPILSPSKVTLSMQMVCIFTKFYYHIFQQSDMPVTYFSFPQVHRPTWAKLAFRCLSMPAILPSCVHQCVGSLVLWTAALPRESPDIFQDGTNLSLLAAHRPGPSGLLQYLCMYKLLAYLLKCGCKCTEHQSYIGLVLLNTGNSRHS